MTFEQIFQDARSLKIGETRDYDLDRHPSSPMEMMNLCARLSDTVHDGSAFTALRNDLKLSVTRHAPREK